MSNSNNVRRLQLWPRGKSVTVRGEWPAFEVKDDAGETWTTPDAETVRDIRIQELAEIYLARDVWHCDSSLVDDCLKMAGEHSGEFFQEWSWDNVVNVYADPSEWTVEQCKEWLDDNGHDTPDDVDPATMDRETMVALLEGAGIQCRDDESGETLMAAILANMSDETIDGLDEWREAVQDNASEHPAEVYEWWRIDPWLAGKLKEIGEVVLDNAYGEWWGRTCCGQGLIMDGTLQKVAAIHVDQK